MRQTPGFFGFGGDDELVLIPDSDSLLRLKINCGTVLLCKSYSYLTVR
jgi:hypothetical protein